MPEDDKFVLCGTTSGDIMKVNLKTGLLSDCGPVKTKHSLVSQPTQIHTVALQLVHGEVLVAPLQYRKQRGLLFCS